LNVRITGRSPRITSPSVTCLPSAVRNRASRGTGAPSFSVTVTLSPFHAGSVSARSSTGAFACGWRTGAASLSGCAKARDPNAARTATISSELPRKTSRTGVRAGIRDQALRRALAAGRCAAATGNRLLVGGRTRRVELGLDVRVVDLAAGGRRLLGVRRVRRRRGSGARYGARARARAGRRSTRRTIGRARTRRRSRRRAEL